MTRVTFSIVNIYTSLRCPQTSITLCMLVSIEFYPHKSHVFSCAYITRAFNLCVVFDKTKTVNSCCQHILHIFVNEVFCYIQNTIFPIVYLENVDCVFKVHIYTVGSCKSVFKWIWIYYIKTAWRTVFGFQFLFSGGNHKVKFIHGCKSMNSSHFEPRHW